MINPFVGTRIGDKLPVFWRQPAVTKPNHLVALHRAFPEGAILRPALRISNKTPGEPPGDPPVVGKHRKVDVNKSIRYGESLPHGFPASVAVKDPLIPF